MPWISPGMFHGNPTSDQNSWKIYLLDISQEHYWKQPIPQRILQENLGATEIHGEYCFLDTTTGSSNILVIFMGEFL